MPNTDERKTDQNGNPIYRIPDQNLEGLSARIAKLNKRAARLKLDPLALTEIGEEFATKRWTDEITGEKREQLIRFVNVTVTGKCPRVNGWAFVATIEHDEAGNILRTVPGFEKTLPTQYRTATTDCDHCNSKRKRNNTYILVSDGSNEQVEVLTWKQVGRNCLADFLRTENPNGMAEWAELLAGLNEELGMMEDEGWEGGGGARFWLGLNTYLSQVATCIRLEGWCSRTAARESFTNKIATADDAMWFFTSKRQYDDDEDRKRRAEFKPTEADRKLATDAISWAQEIEETTGSDYLWNVRVVAHRDGIDGKAAGIAASIIVAYQKHLEREIAKKYERDHPSEWFGEVGKREVLTLTIISLKNIESDFGVTTLVMFRDANGNKAKWFASGNPGWLKLDKTVTVKATIKGHDEYNGSKQTMLTRVQEHVEKPPKEKKSKKAKAEQPAPPEHCGDCGDSLGTGRTGCPAWQDGPATAIGGKHFAV